MDVYVARQPILDRKLGLFAYELLFRAARDATSAQFLDQDVAASHVIVASLGAIGLDDLVGKARAFVNVTRTLLLSDLSAVLPVGVAVIEVLEDVPADPDVVAAVQRLKKQGYVIALDDFVWDESRRPLLELADIVKLDVLGVDLDVVAKLAARVKPFEVQLLAERVETHEVFERCLELGFEYFQGYFFSKPLVVTGRDIPQARTAQMRLLSLLNDPSVEFTEIERVVREDVSLSYKLLRYVNSAAFGRRNPVSSIQGALALLGQVNIRKWATLVLFCSAGEARPPALVNAALVRARLCEALAPRLSGRPDAAAAFTTGLFSLIDALLEVPMDRALAALPLGGETVSALTGGAGPLGSLLALAVGCERGDWAAVEQARRTLSLEPEVLTKAWLEAVRFAADVAEAVREPTPPPAATSRATTRPLRPAGRR